MLSRLQDRGIRLKKPKCKFLQKYVSYLSLTYLTSLIRHILDETGIRQSYEKVNGIKEAPTPKNEAHLTAYLGFKNFSGKCIPNTAARMKSLCSALNQEQEFQWSKAAE